MIVNLDTSLTGESNRDGGDGQRSQRQQSREGSEKRGKSPPRVNSHVSNTPMDDVRKIEALENQLADMKSKRNLELLEESEREESLTEEIDQLYEDRMKLDKDDPAFEVLGEKLAKLRKDLRAIGVENRKKEINYERELSYATSQLNFYRNKLIVTTADDEDKSCSSLSSISTAKKQRATREWVEKQRKAQEDKDFRVAQKLQEEIDMQEKEIQLKKKELHKIKARSVIDDSEAMPPPRTKYAEARTPASVPADKDEMLAAMFARQGSSKDLPYFNGSPEQWIHFKNEFYTTTEQCRFSYSENMSRLQRCLKGEAFMAVKSLFSSPLNVPEIMRRLEDIFGNPEIIIRNLLAEIKQIPPVREGKPEGMVEYGTAVMNLTATLKSLQRPEHLSNPLIVADLQDKLPYQDKLRWVKVSMYGNGDLLSFSSWIEHEVRSARKLCLPKAFVKPEDRRDKEPKQRFQRNTGRCLAVTEKPEPQHKKTFNKDNRPCFYCGKEGHWAGQCRSLLNKKPVERYQLIIDKKLCTSCLIPGHKLKDCRRKKICGERGCKREHHPILHAEEASTSKEPEEPTKEFKEEINSLSSGGDTHMGALPVILTGPDGDLQCLAFIDSGSTVTLLKEDIAARLGLKGPRQPFCLKAFNSDTRYGNSQVTSLGIRGAWNKSKSFTIDGARTVEDMPIGKLSQNTEELNRKYPYLQQVPLASFKDEEPGILIGMREVHLFDTMRSIGDNPDAPRAMQCRLGWRLGGCTSRTGIVHEFHNCNKLSVEDSLTELVKRSFTTEDFGVKAAPTLMSKEDELCKEIMDRTTKRVPGTDRFETGLLWKDPNVVLPESRTMALHRLLCQERKMDRDPAFARAYCEKIEENFAKGFYRKLTPEEAAVRTARTWYLPHFGVWNPNKPGKIRLVMDCRAKSHGISLNDVLMSGPDFNNSLLAVLWRFRQYKYAYAGDIKDMYHRVFIKADERDSQRFLWRGMRRDIPPEEYEMVVLTFGSTCSPSSAQYVKNKNADENQMEFPEASKAIKEETYVDDDLGSKPQLDEARKVVRDIVTVNGKAGFKICNWNSNCPEVLDDIDEDLKCKEIKEIGDREEDAADRVLGLWWMSREDEFTFRLKMHKVPRDILEKKKRPTKRDVLRVAMSVFDPIGFVAHLSIKPKIIIQSLWTKGIGWDDEIPNDLCARWNSWLDELKGLTNVRIPRCYSEHIPVAKSVELHVFCDASEKAFSAIAFLRVESIHGVEVNIVGAKTRVAPLKVLSIPRLELQAAVMGTRLGS